jgi:hypothetical protein
MIKKYTVYIFILVFSVSFLAIAAHQAGAQSDEKEVCLVYFTSTECGDDCRLTDTFIEGLLDEYSGNMTSITYFVDASGENAYVFEVYRKNYNLPQNLPLVLFGKDDYLQGIDDIYENTEDRVFVFLQMNGTNCPLDSGFVPPRKLNPSMLRGQAEIRTGDKGAVGQGSNKEVNPRENGSTVSEGQNPFYDIFIGEEPVKESLLSLLIIAIAAIAVAVAALFAWQKSQVQE